MPLISDSLPRLMAAFVVAALCIAALVLGRELLIPLALAVILTFMLAPLAAWAVARGVPRGAAVGLIMLALVSTAAVAATVLSTQLLSVTTTIAASKDNIAAKIRALGGLAGAGTGDSALGRAAASIEAIEQTITTELGTSRAKGAPAVVVAKEADAERRFPSDTVKALLLPAGMTLLTILYAGFLLMQHHDLRDRIVRVLGTDNLSDTAAAMSEAGERLSTLFNSLTLLNAAFGVVVGIALWIIGVPNPALWGVVATIMRFIPFIGSFLAAAPPILLAAAVDPGWGMVTATMLLFVIGEPLMGHVVEPLVLGRSIGLSPFAMVGAASFWTLLWGPVGLLLAAPLTMVLVVFGQYVRGLEAASVLLGDQPALTPGQQLYHRLLSRDGGAAVEQIDLALAQASPEKVLDDVAFAALRQAADDERRDRLEPEQRDQLAASWSLVTEAMADAAVPAETDGDVREPLPVVLIPARGSLDVLAASISARVLARRAPVDTTVVTSASGLLAVVSASQDERAGPPAAAVLVTVGTTSAAHLKLLVERMARDMPGTRPILFLCGGEAATRSGRALELPAGAVVCRTTTDLVHAMRLEQPRPGTPAAVEGDEPREGLVTAA